MRRHAKVKSANNRMPLRKTATSASAAARRSFPAWIDAGEPGVTFVAVRGAIPRVRDGLVLRSVTKPHTAERRLNHASGAR